jgi:hypothetical protein
MSSRGLAPTFIIVGVLAAASGILVELRGEHASFDDSNAALISLALIIAGLLLTGIGIGTWARRASPLRMFLVAGCIAVAAWVLAEYGHIFAEGSTGISTLLFLAAGAGALFLLVAAAARL